MARITVEDCVVFVRNRFELVLLAAQRTRELFAGAAPTVDTDNDKKPIIALREIAQNEKLCEELRNSHLKSLNPQQDDDTPSESEEEFYSSLLNETDNNPNNNEESVIDGGSENSDTKLIRDTVKS